MRFIVLTLAAIAVVGSTVHASTALDTYESYLRSQSAQTLINLQRLKVRVEQICPGYSDRIIETVKNASVCFNEHRSEETMCSLIKKYQSKCFSPFYETFKECLPEENKFIPEFVGKTMSRVLDFACHTDGEHIFELGNTCIMNINRKTERCIRMVQSKVEQYETKKPTKTDLCSTASSLKGCFLSHINSACNNEITRQSYIGLYDALTSECQDMYITKVDNNELMD
ncbi:unnamed protein product [Brassicogethes aeneus]|uniref:DUF19 domain-containing protein n=1 Tax=Brassicogethes aeneus TaxID=1431903 RepID=A0A9P0B575_BRAAE|nr:unnamed protein product [Brassicogethes aeneus]